MLYLKINNSFYPATFTGKVVDKDWDNRSSKTITFLESSLVEVNSILQDDVEWAIYDHQVIRQQVVDPETDQPLYQEDSETHEQVPVMEDVDVSQEYDNSEYSIKGDVIIHPDGTISVKMGKPTDLELAYELLYGGSGE